MFWYCSSLGFEKHFAAILGFSLLISDAAVGDQPKLQWPVECELGTSCWVARYLDRQDEEGRGDYSCGKRTQDAHNGTDIAIADLGMMAKGVNVVAAADGVVHRLRKGMIDVRVTAETRDEIMKRGCGNVVILRHADGWQTQYCHMKQGSIQVNEGDHVKAGQAIGQVGLSGLTEFPHLHFMVRAPRSPEHQRRSTDPFDGGRFEDGQCRKQPEPLWETEQPYQSVALLPPVIVTERRTRENMWDPQPVYLEADSPALIVQARGFGALKGDAWQIQLTDPDGNVRVNQTIEQARDRQLIQAFAGIRRPASGFKAGTWTASVSLNRAQHTAKSVSGSIVVR